MWVRVHVIVNTSRTNARLDGEPFEEVDGLKYLLSQLTVDGRCEKDVVQRMN